MNLIKFGAQRLIIESSIQKSLDNYFTFDRVLKYVSQDYLIEAKEMIVKFYNFISSIGILSPNVVTQLFYTMDEIGPGKEEENINAVTGSSILGQCISFAKFWASSEEQKLDYDYGFLATSHFFTTFVHEFGHGLNNYAALSSIARAGFNSPPINKELLKNMLCKKYLNTLGEFAKPLLYNIHMKTWYNARLTVLKKFYDFIYKKPNSWFKNIFNCSNCNYNYNYNYFTWWITIPSFYGWSSETEGFAEAFAYYILTPRELRNVPWGWLHQYFTKIFPKLYFN